VHVSLGVVGVSGVRALLGSRLGGVPLVMETPVDDRRGDAENLVAVRGLAGL